MTHLLKQLKLPGCDGSPGSGGTSQTSLFSSCRPARPHCKETSSSTSERMADEPVLKRRRVTQACESCRSLKSKCDGKRPVCSRCKGYGYECRWNERNTRTATSDRLLSVVPDSINESEQLQQYSYASRELLSELREKVDKDDRERIDVVLTSITPSNLRSPINSPTNGSKSIRIFEPFRKPSGHIHRYLGDISDVSFFNSVKGLLENDSSRSHRIAAQLESYERETTELSGELESPSADSALFDRNATDKLINIYFSTIHIAYPFIDRRRFLEDYQKYWNEETRASLPSVSIALLFTIFAIGSYYDLCSMSTQQKSSPHSAYFEKALIAGGCVESEYSVENTRVLLAQSFYYLLVQWTDRCWLTLGLAIRIAQSMGLHIERGHVQNHTTQIDMELQRRTWHSLYVLDRLLSTQLGRPSAIRNQDCTVRLPSRMSDEDFNIEKNVIAPAPADEPKLGDYFIAVIRLSAILRHVERDIYRPETMDYSEDMLQRTDRVDAELLKWRASLPRWLRFDRGHTFERSPVLKRQRNMLAIKFHHLRALIHRPYLCLPWLQRNDNKIKELLDSNAHRVVYFERICVQEAQATAHLLHDVTDKKSLVEDFPWWQMISCLICASSILLVMRAFTPSASYEDESQRESLVEDANTCLKVFDALSLNSDGARRARDMLQNLRDIRAPEEKDVLDADTAHNRTNAQLITDSALPASVRGSDHTPLLSKNSPSFPTFLMDPESVDERYEANFASAWNPQDWPSEIADSMAWSSQFVDGLDHLDLPQESSHST